MSYTKGELVHSALNEIGIADYDFDIAPEQTESGLRRLDSMMAEFNARGVRLGYPIPNTANGSELSQDSNIPDSAWEAVITNLAIRIAPSYGKMVSPDTKITAKKSLNTLYRISSHPGEMQLNVLPRGAGYKAIDRPFTPPPIDPLLNNTDSELDLEGAF